MPLLFEVVNDKIIIRGEKMLYLDVVIYFNSLPAETKIIVLQIICLTLEVLYFFWLRKFLKEEEKRIREKYQRA